MHQKFVWQWKNTRKLIIQKQSVDKRNKKIRNHFRPKKENEAVADKIIRDIKTLSQQKEDYYKPIRAGNFGSNNYIEYESNGYRNKILSITEYLDVIKPYLKDINNLQKSDTCKIQLTIAIDFISSKDIDKELVIHPKSDNIKIISHEEADEVTEELFKSLLSRCQAGLETSMEGSDFIFDCVHLLHQNYHK